MYYREVAEWCERVECAVQAPVDFTDPSVQEAMDASLQLFQSNEYVLPDTTSSWWDAFREYQNGTVSAVRFAAPPRACPLQ